MNREIHARICERLGVKFPGATRQRGETPRAYSPQHLRGQSSRAGTHAGLATGLDRETSATEGERRQKRDREGLGTQVPGVSTGSSEADRDSTGEPGTIPSEGAREMGRSAEWHEYATARRLEPVRARLVGILPTGGSAAAAAGTGGMDSTAYPQVLPAKMARPPGAGTEPASVGSYRDLAGGGDEQSWRLAGGRPTGITVGTSQLRPAAARLSSTIGSCRAVTRLGSTAGCGKPHVRWCGRVTGRNPRHSTRSTSLPH
jgi:hypothetical protein